MYRLAVVTSHPIQNQAPLFRALAGHPQVQLTVYFGSDIGSTTYLDPEFGIDVRWDVPLREGYDSVVLHNLTGIRHTERPWSQVNPGIVRSLTRGRYDAVIVHGWFLATCWISYLSGAILRLPIAVRGESNGLTEPPGMKNIVKQGILRSLFARVDGAIAIGTFNQRFFMRYGMPSRKIFLAPYSVDNCFFEHQARLHRSEREAMRANLGIARDDTVFLFAGKLSTIKRPLDLLEAFTSLSTGDKAYLVYIGDGKLRQQIEEFAVSRAMKNVLVTGFQNQSHISRWYSIADVLVLPSGFEPWGLVVNEAMNFGIPVIASDRVGAVPDLIKHGDTGLVFPAGDIAALASAMQQVHTDPAGRRRMGQNALTRIGGWGVPQTVQGYIEALEGIVGT